MTSLALSCGEPESDGGRRCGSPSRLNLGGSCRKQANATNYENAFSPLVFPHIPPLISASSEMAPTPRPMSDTILLELTLLSPLKLTDDVLREIKRLARLTTALTILVRTRPAQRSAGAAPTSSERYLDGLDWDEFQAVVVRIYTAATEVYLKENRPLSVVDVLFDSIRNGKELAGSWNGTVIYSQQATTDSASTKELVAGVESEGGEIRGERLFEVTALGGTFDHLHAGHKILLTMAAWITTRRLIVGITGQSFSQSFLLLLVARSGCVQRLCMDSVLIYRLDVSLRLTNSCTLTDDVLLKNKKFSQHLESLEVRQQAVRRFVNLLKPQLTLDTPPLQVRLLPIFLQLLALALSKTRRTALTRCTNAPGYIRADFCRS